MFDLDLGGSGREGMDLEVDASSESGRSRSAGHDSGFGSMQPPMGFFQAHASGKGASMI